MYVCVKVHIGSASLLGILTSRCADAWSWIQPIQRRLERIVDEVEEINVRHACVKRIEPCTRGWR